MVAVLTVFAFHLTGWPKGGFVGVDVFFVISGFLITGNLLRMAETSGNVSFRKFYWNRVRRIIPAATVVLAFTYGASLAVFLPFRANQVGIDAVWAFVFLSNWRFAVEGTDYFTASETVSPIQHYWSLSIEEQFYFVWPALIFLIGILVARRAWTHRHRMRTAGIVMVALVVVSLGWAIYQTHTAPTWAYFDTFARVWELGAGALLATTVGALGRIPARVKPWLSWAGLGLITASVVLIAEGSPLFPAPWAILPVLGSVLVIAAGVKGEPAYQQFLRNPASVYVGNISYSLYLVHWPVIIILGALMQRGWAFYAAVVALSFGLAIASYHLVENPLRRFQWSRFQFAAPAAATRYAVMASLGLIIVSLAAFTLQPAAHEHADPPSTAILAGAPEAAPEAPLGPLGSALRAEIVEALKATDWPVLNPSMEAVIKGPIYAPEVKDCSVVGPVPADCTWGSPTAAVRVVLVGNSAGVTYAGPLREIALNSGGVVQVHDEAMGGCTFSTDLIQNSDADAVNACPARKQEAVDYINAAKPDVVIIANTYGPKPVVGGSKSLTDQEWSDSLHQLVDKFRGSTKRVVFLAPPRSDIEIGGCYGNRLNTPADCISGITPVWRHMAEAEQYLAEAIGGLWVDSGPWFCSHDLCPSFVGTIPTMRDSAHMSPEYGHRIFPVIAETFRADGVF